METIFLIALVGFAVLLLLSTFDSLFAVSRRPAWPDARLTLRAVAAVADRRKRQLPFVGADRREGMAARLVSDAQVRLAA